MKKLELLGVGKSEKHNHYTFRKEQAFFEMMRRLLEFLGFDRFEYDSVGRPHDEKYGEPIFDKEADISGMVDCKSIDENDQYYVETIYGKDKVFLLIHTKKNMQQKISKFIFSYVKTGTPKPRRRTSRTRSASAKKRKAT